MKTLTYEVMNAAYAVHSALGPGLLESVYEKALVYELKKRGYDVESQKRVPILYDGIDLNTDEKDALRLDILVNDCLIVELKSVDKLQPVHFKQVRTYMRLLGIDEGLLINFNVAHLKEGAKTICIE